MWISKLKTQWYLPEALSGHECSSSHVEAFGKWKEFELRLRLRVSIDQTNQKIQLERVEYWRHILRRLISVIRLIATQNLALRGSSDTLFSAHNGIFLKIMELIAKFDPLMREHIQRSSSKEIKTHYLGKKIQNEICSLIADKIINRIISNLRSAKYYSLIDNCSSKAKSNWNCRRRVKTIGCRLVLQAQTDSYL